MQPYIYIIYIIYICNIYIYIYTITVYVLPAQVFCPLVMLDENFMSAADYQRLSDSI